MVGNKIDPIPFLLETYSKELLEIHRILSKYPQKIKESYWKDLLIFFDDEGKKGGN
jgi:hypothetical protein